MTKDITDRPESDGIDKRSAPSLEDGDTSCTNMEGKQPHQKSCCVLMMRWKRTRDAGHTDCTSRHWSPGYKLRYAIR
ncbi:hypothetical protein PAXRUDRAFT_824106 [Paxillus rubicundulus Ve08.2h10]|uniref:Unplaced genomic scaffold scaffold_80, whole genome shotgun sequence n=1 Tax=Paxillus rubicundulus Ve08.2h10 TaxID=930991 RepID=A0A0D0E2G0_9AGAM|nr:hypothetical protein PAXRUDRAFT_824106 [Paxillus rubicundulus Ve08.2h10]